jgi:putative oxidoreductase
MDIVRAPLRWLGRVTLSAMFIAGGVDAFRQPAPRAPKAASLGIPSPELAVRANGAAMVAAGVALALGYRPRTAAAVLAGLLVPTTLAGHPFWTEQDPAARAQQRVQFLKNLGLLGGALLVLAERPKPSR